MADSIGRRIGLLTGTFDPVHLGHVELAEAARRKCGLDEVWLMVNAKQVNSPVERKDGVTAQEHRLAMAELAVAGGDGVAVYRGALAERPHTMRTFGELAGEYPGNQFVFVVGMDALVRLDGWEDFESVVKNASFAVARRRGTSEDAVDDLRRRLGDLGGALKVKLFEFDDHGAATSREIRRQVRMGERPESLDVRVHEYIRERGLYR